MRPRLLPLMALLALMVLGAARPADAAWNRLRSDHFTVVGNASVGRMREVARQLEQFRLVMLALLPPGASPSPVPTVVVVFGDTGSMRPYWPLVRGKTFEVSGMFQGGPDVNYISVNGEFGEPALESVQYAYAAAILSDGPRLPSWLWVGLAELYQTFQSRRGGLAAVVGIAPRGHFEVLREVQGMKLAELFAVQPGDRIFGEGIARQVFTAQCWGLVHYLTLGNPTYGAKFPEFLAQLRSGESSESAIRRVFGVEPEMIEAEFRASLRKYVFPAIELTFEEKTSRRVDTKAEPLSDKEASGYLGDLLVHLHRGADARKLLEKVAGPGGDTARATAALGLLEWDEEHPEKALELLQRAASFLADDAVVKGNFARLLMERYVDTKDKALLTPARVALERAVELDDENASAAYMRGYVALLEDDDEVAVRWLKQAATLAPARERYRLLLARAQLNTGQLDAATATLGPLMARGQADTRTEAREMMGEVATAKARAVKPAPAP